METVDAGKYDVAFVFDDTNKTMVYDNVSLEITGIAKPKPDEPDDGADSEDGDDSSGTGTDNGAGSGDNSGTVAGSV